MKYKEFLKTFEVRANPAGASVSVLPRNKNIKKISKDCVLYAANDTRINTYGFK